MLNQVSVRFLFCSVLFLCSDFSHIFGGILSRCRLDFCSAKIMPNASTHKVNFALCFALINLYIYLLPFFLPFLIFPP